MKWLFGSLLILIAAVIVGLWAYQDSGYVLIARGYTTVEMSLALFIVLAAAGFLATYFALRVVINSWHMPSAFREWRARQRRRRARRDMNRGLIELAQGNWAPAERYLLRHARDSEIPLLNYLSAARAAQKQNAPQRRDDYLSLAHQSMQGAGFAVQLTQAELQLVHGQLEQSLATLMQLHATSPKHPHVLYLLARSYQLLRSWDDLRKLLPDLRKQNVLNPDDLHQLEQLVYRELLTLATQRGKLEVLRDSWQQTPKHLRQDLELIRHYVRCLLILRANDDAEHLLRDALKRRWDVDLVYIYGLVEAADKDRQLATAETWLKGHENNPVLLLTLGRLCKRNKLWGKARSYLNASLGIKPHSDAYKELGQLLEQLNEHSEAVECYHKGLLLAADEKMDTLLNVMPANTALAPVTY
ncbi:MAG: heme biosynthesis protein HemY [Gammaproteobacteria bacterium]|nr:heme biosynthesis protein HemY [Gammaproteobacteria bacterium]